MGTNAKVFPWIRIMSEYILKAVFEMVEELEFCLVGIGCIVVAVMLCCYVLGIAASSVRGVSETCVSFHCP